MSTAIGSFFTGDDPEPRKSSDADGIDNAQDGARGNQGDVDRTTSESNLYEYVNPANVTERIEPRVNTGGNGEPRRTKSGRIDRRTKAGRNGASETQSDLTQSVPRGGGKLVSLEKAIFSLHDMAAGIFGIPEIEISEAEAKSLNDAVLDVSKYYVQAFDPKKVAIFNLVMCMGGIYATRVMAYRNRMQNESRGKLSVMPNPQPEPVSGVPMTVEQYLGTNPPVIGGGGY